MKIEANRQYKTKSGKNVYFYTIYAGGSYPVHGVVENEDTKELHKWTIEGKSCGYFFSGNDLVEDYDDWIFIKEAIERNKSATIVVYPKSPASYLKHINKIREMSNGYVDIFEIGALSSSRYSKEDVRLATKEEVIEYFFGEEK